MDRKPDITLADIRKSGKFSQTPKVRSYRVSDFVSKQEQAEIKIKARARRSQARQIKYDAVDAMVAEMIARFGYQFYLDWKNPDNSDITTQKVVKLLAAERARDHEKMYTLEVITALSLAGCQQPRKNKGISKGMRQVQKILKHEENIINQRRNS